MVTTYPESTTAEPSTATFDGLNLRSKSLQALAEIDITTPSPIQAATIPVLLDGKDLIGQARTGSGKTLAFVLPAMEIVNPNERVVQVLVLTPTRELAVQVGGVFDQIGRHQGVKTVLVFGGRSAKGQISAIRRGAQVVVGTPGRVLDLIRQRALRLNDVRFLVLDEADGMLDSGFGPDVERIIDQTPRTRQTALFSATVPEWVDSASAKHLKNPQTMTLDVRPEDSAPVDHQAYEIADGDKKTVLRELLDHRRGGSIIVFGRTKHGVKKLAKVLGKAGYPVAAIQGNLSQNARDRVMNQFRSGIVQILVATNVAARGLDISSVDLVINVDLPESSDLLTHRIGRTGRMGRQGQAITLLAPQDVRKWRQLERDLGKKIARMRWPGAEKALEDAPDNPLPRSAPIRSTRNTQDQETPNTGNKTANRKRNRPRHQITCDRCGKIDHVPFKPNGSRPVYCSDCFGPPRHRRRQSA